MLKIIAKRHFTLLAMCFLYSASAFSVVIKPGSDYSYRVKEGNSASYEVPDLSILNIKNHWGKILLEGHDSDQMEVRTINLSSKPVTIKIEGQDRGVINIKTMYEGEEQPVDPLKAVSPSLNNSGNISLVGAKNVNIGPGGFGEVTVGLFSPAAPYKEVGLIIKFPRRNLAQLYVNSGKGLTSVSNLEASGGIWIYSEKGEIYLNDLNAGGRGIHVRAARSGNVHSDKSTTVSSFLSSREGPFEVPSSTSSSEESKEEVR